MLDVIAHIGGLSLFAALAGTALAGLRGMPPIRPLHRGRAVAGATGIRRPAVRP